MTVTDLPKLLDDVKKGHRLTDEEDYLPDECQEPRRFFDCVSG